MISRKFIKNSAIYTLAGALPMASAILLIPFYILYLPVDVYGVMAICLTFSALVQILVTYSFDSSLYIHYHEFKNDKKKLASFISASFIFIVILGIAIALVLSISGQFIFSVFLTESKFSFYPYGLISAGIGIFQAIFKVHGNLLQTREKPETFLWSNVSSFALVAILTIIGLNLFPGTLIGPLGGRLIAAVLSGLWALTRVFKEFGFHAASPWKNTSFSFNLYTFFYQLQQWVINYFHSIIILFFMPAAIAASSVGIYEFAIKCLAPVELLLNGLNASMFPQVIKLINNQKESPKSSTPEINRYFYGQISIIMLMICLAILFLPWLGEWFIHKSNYLKALEYLPYIAVIFILRSMRLYFVVPYNVLKKMDRLTGISFAVAALKVVLMIVFIEKWQLFGVIMASGVAYMVEMILLWYYLKNDYLMKFNPFKLMIGPMLLFMLVLMAEPLLGNAYPEILHAGYIILCSALLWFLYRNELVLFKFSKFLK